VRAQLAETLRVAQQHPALQAIQERVQNAMQGFGERVEAQAQRAAQRVEAEQRRTIQGLGDQLDQLMERVNQAATSPLESALARIRREFAGMTDQLDMLVLKLAEMDVTAGREQHEAIMALLARIPQQREQLAQAYGPGGRLELGARAEDTERARRREADLSARQYETIQGLQDQLAELRYRPGFFGEGVRPREQRALEYGLTDAEGRRQAERLQEQIRAQQRLNYAAQLFEQVGGNVAQAWTGALTSIADGTRTVSEAFREMARSILQSLAQIAAQEGFRALIRLGVGLIAGGATAGLGGGGVGLGAPAAEGGTSAFDLSMAGTSGGLWGGSGLQHGGIVRRPSFAMLAETGPEAVVPLSRMQEFAQAVGPRAGSQGLGQAGISIINVGTRAEAEAQAAQQRAMGRQAVINYVMQDLQKGEASTLNRTLRTLQR
jgi:hypothetical protein